MWRRLAKILVIAAGFAVGGCGGSSSSQSTQPPPPTQAPPPPTPSSAVSITSISPNSASSGSADITLIVSGTNLTPATHNVRRVEWSVNSVVTALATTPVSSTQLSALIPAALLTAPAAAQVFVEYGDPMADVPLSRSNSLPFSVTAAAASVVVSPASVTLGPKNVQQFAAKVNNSSSPVTWGVLEGSIGGSITASGLYTVPDNIGTFHVMATLVADASQTANAAVSVVPSGFVATASLSVPRSGHTATLLANSKVLIVGGGDDSAELFDPSTNTFAPTGPATTLRFGAAATLLANGKVLITGGFGQGTSVLPILNTAELYDPATGTFSATGNMVVPRVRHTATLLGDGRVLIAGGIDSTGAGGAAVASAELYDPATGTFTLTGGMFTDRAKHAATILASGEVLIVGGWNGHGADAADDPPWDPLFVELFQPPTGAFAISGSMSTTRIASSVIRLTNGKVSVFGGVPAVQNIHSQPPAPAYAEVYDPATHVFSALATPLMPWSRYTSTLLNDGTVLLAGGEDLGATVGAAELLDPASGRLTATGGLTTPRTGHTATRLNDGRVLIAGGLDANGKVIASAEIYK